MKFLSPVLISRVATLLVILVCNSGKLSTECAEIPQQWATTPLGQSIQPLSVKPKSPLLAMDDTWFRVLDKQLIPQRDFKIKLVWQNVATNV